MKREKNILLVVNQLHGGGAQKVTANLSIHLSQSYNVTIVIYNDIETVVFDHSGKLIPLKLPFSTNTHKNSSLKRFVRFVWLVRKLRKVKKQEQIDVSISFMEASNIVNVLSSTGEKIILSVRSYLSHEFNDHPRLKVFKSALRLLYNRSFKVVVPAELLKDDLVRNFGVSANKIRVIYNFIDPDYIERRKKDAIPEHLDLIFENSPVIINVGRITHAKAQWLLIPVVAQVKKIFPRVKLIVLGDGPLKERILQGAVAEGLNVYIEGVTPLTAAIENFDIYLLGFTKNPFPYLSKSQLFIKTSAYEGFPNVIIEAMASGLPVISTDCESGPREILSPDSDYRNRASNVEYGQYGVLLPVCAGEKSQGEFTNAAASAIISLLASDEKTTYYRNQSSQRAKDFHLANVLIQWIEIIEAN